MNRKAGLWNTNLRSWAEHNDWGMIRTRFDCREDIRQANCFGSG
jgi:hypothetical protein